MNWFAPKLWQKLLIGFFLLSSLGSIGKLLGGNSTSAVVPSTAPIQSSLPSQPAQTATASPTPALVFSAPEWLDPTTAQAYSNALSVLSPKTNMDVPRIISVEFIDFDDGTYGTFIEIAADDNLTGHMRCEGAAFDSEDLFIRIMNAVPYDFGKYKLDVLNILARFPGTDDYGNSVWVTLKGTILDRSIFTKVNWANPDIKYSLNWDKLIGRGPCPGDD